MRKTIFIIFTFIGLIFFPSTSNAQWYLVETQDTLCRYHDVTVTDDSIVFVCGRRGFTGVILRSLDLGNSFDTTLLSGETCYDITFPTNLIGYATVSPSYIYKTTDGGWTWNSILDTAFINHSGDIFFLNADTGFYSFQDGGAGFFRTFDGGGTWTQMIDSAWGLLGGRELVYNNNNLYAVCGNGYLKSSDYGVNWDLIYYDNIYNTNFTINVIDATVWMAGMGPSMDAIILKSTNAGITWNYQINTNVSTHRDMVMLNPLTGHMISDPPDTLFRFLKTTDGGINWCRQECIGTYIQPWFYMLGIDCLNDSVCFAVGDFGSVFKTYNGGGQLIDIGLPTISYDSSVKIYPNPINNLAMVEFDYYENEEYCLTVYNSIGQRVAQITDISSGKVLVDATEYNKGMYFFELRNGSRIMRITKLIKE